MVVKYVFLRESNQFHQGILSFHLIKSWLLDGGHKMYKVENSDELEAWLKHNDLSDGKET